MSVKEHEEPLLEVTALRKYFPIRSGFFKRVVGYVKAVDEVSLYIMEGETLGLVGESGCGKTTTGRSIMRAIEPTSGRVMFRDPTMGPVSITELDKDGIRQIRRSMRMIFQDPYASLNPRMTLLDIVGAPLRAMKLAKGSELEDRVAEMLRRVEALEQQVATLQASHEAHIVGSVEGLDWTLTVSGFPESEGME